MSRIKFFVILLLSVMIIFGCGWSEDDKKEFQTICAQDMKVFRLNSIDFYGFNRDEIDTIKIVEFGGSSKCDTIEIYTDSLTKNTYSISPSVELKIGYTYHFYIDSVKHVVSDIHVGLSPTFTMFNEDYECAFIYRRDGLVEHNPSLSFVKEVYSK